MEGVRLVSLQEVNFFFFLPSMLTSTLVNSIQNTLPGIFCDCNFSSLSTHIV